MYDLSYSPLHALQSYHTGYYVSWLLQLLSYDVDSVDRWFDDGAIFETQSFQSDQKVHKTTITVFKTFACG